MDELHRPQIVKGDLAEQAADNSQVVQVAWQGGITPVDKKITEKDLFQFYTVYVEDDDSSQTDCGRSKSDWSLQ